MDVPVTDSIGRAPWLPDVPLGGLGGGHADGVVHAGDNTLHRPGHPFGLLEIAEDNFHETCHEFTDENGDRYVYKEEDRVTDEAKED